jgi:hypothetical protein
MKRYKFLFKILLVTSTCLFAMPVAADDGTPPEEVEAMLSDTDTSYTGARLLKEGEDVYGAYVAPGTYEDQENEDLDRYAFWQGDSLFFGATNPESGNTVDGVAEFYWFESSIPKSSDFYVMVLKVKSAPNAVDDWALSQEDNWLGEFMYDIDACQSVGVHMGESGGAGAIRWDWSVPFQNYKWEPVKTIQMEQSYSAGFDASVGGSASADPAAIAGGLITGDFKEGGFLKDLTTKVDIQSKGYINKQFQVSSNYSVTLYKWEMVVLGGADSMNWHMVVSKDGSTANDSAYHEYFVVIQSTQGMPVKVDEINIAAKFRHNNQLWFDGWDSLSVSVQDVEWLPPADIECYAGDIPPEGFCQFPGVCADAVSICAKGTWMCIMPEAQQTIETLCDGLDNDCDGVVDDNLMRVCNTACGKGVEYCSSGMWVDCDAQVPTVEVCDGWDNNCDGLIDNHEDCYGNAFDEWFPSTEDEDDLPEPVESVEISEEPADNSAKESWEDEDTPNADTGYDPATWDKYTPPPSNHQSPETITILEEPGGCNTLGRGQSAGILFVFLGIGILWWVIRRRNEG